MTKEEIRDRVNILAEETMKQRGAINLLAQLYSKTLIEFDERLKKLEKKKKNK